MIKHLFVVLLIFIPLSLMAQSDPWNTYQWNRKNIQDGDGVVDKSLWYEWWYYKIVIPGTGKSFFFVYGVVNPWDLEQKSKGTRSYVGMGDFANKDQVEEQFNVSDFSASYSETYVVINRNTATDKFFNGSLKNDQGETYDWDVKISKHWAYNAEGWMMGSMITDIEWYPAQASASCTGSVTSRGEKTTFKDVPCYQDRNWGKSFPDWWTWIVSNHFEGHPGTALAIGGGKPKVRGTRTPVASVSIGLTHMGKDYSFRPVDMQLVMTDVNFGKWKVWAMGKKYKIEVEAYAPKEEFMDLQFVTPSGEIFHDYETLTGQLRVKLYERNGIGLKLIADLVSSYAGIEFGSTKNYREKLLESFGPDKETPIILHSL